MAPSLLAVVHCLVLTTCSAAAPKLVANSGPVRGRAANACPVGFVALYGSDDGDAVCAGCVV